MENNIESLTEQIVILYANLLEYYKMGLDISFGVNSRIGYHLFNQP
jgi:hypothetical protein